MRIKEKHMKINAALFIFGLTGMAVALSIHADSKVITYQRRIQSGGTNYTGVGRFKAALVTSTNLNALAEASSTVSGGFVTIIDVDDTGSGYVSPPSVSIVGGGGSGALASASVSGGMVVGITVDDPGSGYTSEPLVVIDSPPENLLFSTYWSND